jgi:hypothetical protein
MRNAILIQVALYKLTHCKITSSYCSTSNFFSQNLTPGPVGAISFIQCDASNISTRTVTYVQPAK